jgi:hypothetical protein
MDAGQTVYRPYVGMTLSQFGGVVTFFTEGTVTEIVADGEPLVRDSGGTLSKVSAGWCETQAEANRAMATALAEIARGIHEQIDGLRTQVRNEVAA